MRTLLATAVAIAPILAATGAQAEIVISTSRTTPIQTSNATGSARDDIRMASGGTISLTSGAAITLDSNNSVDLDMGSAITMAKSADGATGIHAIGGNTGNITVGGGITITDALDAADHKDADGDGDLDGQFAVGFNRYGVRVTGPAPLTGNILLENGSAILVEGNNSAGVSVETGLNGALTSMASVRVVGDNTHGIRTTGPVTGNVAILGSVNVQGANATAVAIDGDVGGALRLQSTITATGYRYTTSPPSSADFTGEIPKEFLVLEDLDADDLLQGGPGVRVAGNVAGGILLASAPIFPPNDGDADGDGIKNGDEDDDGDGIKNSLDPDRNGDGIPDAAEGTAAINVFGGAPALVVGAVGRDINIGNVGADDNAYGMVNRGAIAAAGVYKGVNAVGVQFGVEGGGAVNLNGGLRNANSITATAVDGNATAIQVGSGVTMGSIVNSGAIQAGSTSNTIQNATAVLINQGANVQSLTNSGFLTSAYNGNQGDAYAIRDQSGSLTSLTNSGSIAVARVPSTKDTNPVSGNLVAVDLSANTSGVTLRQFGRVTENPGPDLPDADGDGVIDKDEPSIVGAIRLGSGADRLQVENGTIVGDIAFGAGADVLDISGGAVVSGAITDTDGLLDINISKGTLAASQTSVTTISNLTVGAEGNLAVTVDPKQGNTGGFNVTGEAVLADGAKLGLNVNSLITGTQRFTVLTAETLTVGNIDQKILQENSPYIFRVESGIDRELNEVYIEARRRTADEAGMIKVESQAYDAIYDALGQNKQLETLFLTQTGRAEFFNAYEQMLPDHSGGTLMSLSAGVDAVTRALTGRNAAARPGETSAWLQEINFYADKDKTDTYGFRSEGFGVAGGFEKGTGLGAIGVSAAFTSSDISDPESEAEEVLSASLLELGLYWRAQGQYWTTWARAAGGYASFTADRSLVAGGLYLKNTSDWHGWTAAAAGGASYERHFGRLNIRPEAYAEYFYLSEDARKEKGGGEGFDLQIDARDSHLMSAVAAVNIGYSFGRNGWLRPEVRVGYRQNLSVDAGETIGRFRTGGPDFRLTPDSIEGGGFIAGFRVNFGNELGMLSLTGDAEMLEDYIRYSLLLRASFRF